MRDAAVCKRKAVKAPLARTIQQIMRMVIFNNTRCAAQLLERLQASFQRAHERLQLEQEKGKPFQIYFSLKASFYEAADSSETTTPLPCFNSKPLVILVSTDAQEVIEKVYANLVQQIDNFEKSGSGWVLGGLVDIDINFAHFNPLRASSFVKMPEKNLNTRKATSALKTGTINVFL